MRDIGVVANSGSRLLSQLSSESWTQRLEDVYSILAGSYIVSVHKPKEGMQFGIGLNGRDWGFSMIDVDTSLLVKKIEPTPAFMPRPLEPHYRHVLDAQFQDGRFLFGSEYDRFGSQRITNLTDLRNFLTVEMRVHPLAIFQKPGLPEGYRNAVSAMLI